MTKQVEILNRRFGETLGRPNGNDPRFAWQWSPDVVYYYRPDMASDYERRSWADRIGPRWMLCQWKPPAVMVQGIEMEVTREQWMAWHQGRRPFPARGEYQPHPETALPIGMLPTAELTAGYIHNLREQMERAEAAQKAEFAGRMDATTEQCEREAQAQIDQAEKEFFEQVGDWEPASWKLGEPRDPGDQDGPIAFQAGIGESPTLAAV